MLSDENAVFRPEQTVKARSGKGRRSEQGWLNGMESAQNTERRRSRSQGRQMQMLMGNKRSPYLI